MPGALGPDQAGSRITEPGPHRLIITAAEEDQNDYGAFVQVSAHTADGEMIQERVSTTGKFAWKLGAFLSALKLPHGKGDPWDEAEWIGKTFDADVAFGKKGYPYCTSYSAVPDGEELHEEIPF